jgi:hypothetical protein
MVVCFVMILKWKKYLDEGLKKANAASTSSAQIVQKYKYVLSFTSTNTHTETSERRHTQSAYPCT